MAQQDKLTENVVRRSDIHPIAHLFVRGSVMLPTELEPLR